MGFFSIYVLQQLFPSKDYMLTYEWVISEFITIWQNDANSYRFFIFMGCLHHFLIIMT